ncbi:hypothetical protein ACFLZW_02130 [Chloroflexota bacterium]
MLTMQAFHNRLFSATTYSNPYLECLIHLTRIGIREVAALNSDIMWNYWNGEAA